MMDMIAPDDQRVRVAAVGRDGVVLRFGDLAVLNGDMPAGDETQPDAATAKVQPAYDEMGRLDDLEIILRQLGFRRARDNRPRVFGRANGDGFARQAVQPQRAHAGLRVDALMQD
jgi:hypothetical protein